LHLCKTTQFREGHGHLTLERPHYVDSLKPH